MLRLDNSKRMAALKGILKEEKKKNEEKKKSSKSTASTSSRSSNGSQTKLSKSSSKKTMTSKRLSLDHNHCCEPPPVESSMEFVNPKNAIQVQKSWEQIRRSVDDYELRVGEEVFLAMMEINPSIRQATGITSLRSSEFDDLCKRITGHIQYLVNATGPSISLEFGSLDLSDGLERDKLPPALLADAVPLAMKKIIGPDHYTEEVADAWGYFFVKHVARMTRD